MDRSLAPAAPLRARPRARGARAPAAPRLRLAGRLGAGAALAAQTAGALWRRRRLRLAIIALAALGSVGAGGWVWLRHSSLVSVQHVRITGVRGPDAAAIEAALNVAARRMSTLDVHPGALQAAVAPFAMVREVKASASFPHSLRIHVVEQLPAAALVANGTRTAVAANGVVLGPALLSGSLPTLEASWVPAPGQLVSDESLRGALVMLGAAPAPLARLITRAYTGKQGITVALRGGLSAYFGDSSRPHAKWLALALVLASERAAGASYVDVRVPERPAAGYASGSAPPASGEGSANASGSTSATQTTSEAGNQESLAAALAANLVKAVGSEQAGAPAALSAKSTSEEAKSKPAGEGRESASASGENAAGSRSESGSETEAGTTKPGH
jgi:cell division protein FtsQ